MLGHSALAMRQWEVASMEVPPPHLKEDLLRGYNNLVNQGRHSIHIGGRFDSYLQVPVISEAGSYGVFGGRKVAEG
jgi:hypothetical protein